MAGPTAFPASAIVSGTIDRQRIPAVESYGMGLAKFRRAIDGTTEASGKRNIVALVLGDSLGGRIASRVADHLAQNLGFSSAVSSLGGSGHSVDTSGRNLKHVLDGGATLTSSNYTYHAAGRWFTLDATGEAIRFFGSNDGVVAATAIKIYYVKEPGAGAFRVETGSGVDSGFTEQVASVSADEGASPTLGIVTLSLASAGYSVRVSWLSGSVRILDVAFLNSTSPRIEFCDCAVGGQDPEIYGTVNGGMMRDLIADLNPDVIMFMFDDTAAKVAVAADKIKEWVDQSGIIPPLVMAFGCGPKNGFDSVIEAQNALIEQKSSDYGWAFVNGFKAMGGSWAALNTLGWGGDGTHLSDRAYSALASLMLSKLGFSFEPKSSTRKVVDYQDATSVGVRRLAIAKDAITTPAGLFLTDASFGSQLTIRTADNQGVIFQNNSLTVWARLSSNHAVFRSFFPSGFAIGATTGPQIISGSADPEGSVTAPVGSLYMRTSGGAGTTLYVKESGTGNTGWVGK